MDAYLALLPQEMVRGMNFSMIEPNLTGYMAGYFYGFLILLFPLIYSDHHGQPRHRQLRRFRLDGLPAVHAQSALEDRPDPGFLSIWQYQNADPYSRPWLGILISEAMSPATWISGALYCSILARSCCIMRSAASASSHPACSTKPAGRWHLGAGLPVLFLLMKMLADVDERLAGVGRVSLISLFDPAAILAGDSSVLPSFLALFAIGTMLYAAGLSYL
jgi:ABC-2 type transport system permease protein